MVRKAGHRKLPSPEIPRGSPPVTRTRSQRRSPPPPVKEVLAISDTEDEEEAESRSQQLEGEDEEENEEAREGKGEDINLQADYNAQDDSQEDDCQQEEEVENGEDDGDIQNESEDDSENEYSRDGYNRDYDDDGDGRTLADDDGRFAQSRLDPSLLLANIEHLDDAASNVLDYFLRSTEEGDELYPKALTDVMAFYTYAPEGGHLNHGIDPRNIASILGVDHYENGLDKSFDPIFRKANLAAFTLLALHSKPPKYYTLAVWDQVLARVGCYDGVEDASNFEFVKELRTQVYIYGMAMQKEIRPNEHPNWPDKILLGAFCGGDPPNELPFERTSAFKQKLKTVKLMGWDSEGGEIKEIDDLFRKSLMDHITLLRTYTEDVDGTPTADTDGLKEEYPYGKFQEKYLEWLRKACYRISLSTPPIDLLRGASKRLAQDFENFHDNFEQYMKEPQSEDNPGSRSPSMIQPSRRTTGTSIVEEVLKEPPQTSLRTVSSSKHLDSATRNRLIKVKESTKAAGKPIFRSSTGLMLPTSSQTQPTQDKGRDRRSAPSTFVTGSGTGFDINESLAKAARQEEKENMMPAIPKGSKKKRFNESQEGRTSINFSDDNDASTRPAPPRTIEETALTYEKDPSLPEEGDDSDIVPAPGPSRLNKRARAASDDEDESDDHAANNRNAGMRKKPRFGDVVVNRRARRFEPQKGASRPERHHTPPPPPRPAQDDDGDEDDASDSSGRERERERRETSEDSDDPLEPFILPPRKNWSEAEVSTLVKAVGKVGTRWAVIRDRYFPGTRTDVNLKDKARNLKFEYLKRGKRLPHNFERVTIDNRMLANLRKQGLRYRNGDIRATRL
ncbi:uncharacterized protein DFL_001054 [Arthrobotrys flagrans]|uniref:Uncharacterized protein n=1 Tax=Arthrobotrys flagrans TaxID=97331 RepID=A0A437AG17_ARTFL|nr:hypothetical protein DFL_001054 [Arthrobotrys flagrans]